MNTCTTREPVLDADFLDSPEAARLVAPTSAREITGVPAVRFRMLAWPAHITNLLRARYRVAPQNASVATVARLMFEDLRALRGRDAQLVTELYEEVLAFYEFLTRVRPHSNAGVVHAWLAQPKTARRLRGALGC